MYLCFIPSQLIGGEMVKLEEAIVEQTPPMYIASELLGDGAQSKVYKAHV